MPIREMLNDIGLTEQKWRILRVLDEEGPSELTVLAQGACLLLPSLTRIAKSLEADGLVQRRSDPDDGRKSVVQITQAGVDILTGNADRSAAIFATLEDRFGAERLEKLLDLLAELDE